MAAVQVDAKGDLKNPRHHHHRLPRRGVPPAMITQARLSEFAAAE
jgi:hypothetical protein